MFRITLSIHYKWTYNFYYFTLILAQDLDILYKSYLHVFIYLN
jgi:hypothetical protein